MNSTLDLSWSFLVVVMDVYNDTVQHIYIYNVAVTQCTLADTARLILRLYANAVMYICMV